jgi:hypothetical protein
MKSNKTLIDECLVPQKPSSIRLSKVDRKDLRVLNSISRVYIDQK